MSLKYRLKEKLPPGLFHVFKGIYKQRGLFRYWLPYIFCRGRALPPTRITLEVTFRCNQKCLMCPQATEARHDKSQLLKKRKVLKELSTAEICSLVDEASRMKIKEFNLTGGEPFLRKDLIQIIRHIKQQGLDCAVLSNGTLIGQELAREIVAAKLDRLTFSLDGPQEVHDKIRNTRNAFANLMQAVSYLKAEKEKQKSMRPYISFSSTISAVNDSSLSRLMDIAGQQGMDMNFGYLFYTTQEMTRRTKRILEMGDAKDEDQDIAAHLKRVDIERLNEELDKIREKERRLNIKATFQPPLKGEELYRRFYDDSFAYATKCFYPWYGVRINPYGEVYPCSMNILMGNIRQYSLGDIWNNEQYVIFRKSLKKNRLFPKCIKCCVLNNKLWTYLPVAG